MGITVTVENVTIDFNGYSLIGGGYDVYTGVYMNTKKNVEIRNGTIRNFQTAIYESNTDARNHRVINVRAVSNSLSGIHLRGRNHLVKDCIASENGASASWDVYGIYVGKSSAVTGCTANDNGTLASDDVYGMYADAGSTVTGNIVSNNGYAASTGFGYIYGIRAEKDCTVTGNTACGNGDLAADVGAVCGICAQTGSTVTGNTASENGASATGIFIYGILAYAGSTVTGNTARANGDGATATGYGIFLEGSCLVDQNTAYNNNGTNMIIPSSCTLGVNEY
jgi:hypothetical protein